MPRINELLKQIQRDFSHYRLEPHDCFKWIPTQGVIGYKLDTDDATNCFDLLHELAHAELAHAHYRFDIELLRQESGAWELARGSLAPRYGVAIEPEYIEQCMDSYRDWLHTRSLCPNCDQTGLQIQQSIYSCVNCRQPWRVNDARQCALRRRLV